MNSFTKFIIKFRYVFVAVFMVLFVAGIILIPQVSTNYDLSLYLASDSDTLTALEKMDEEFASSGSAQLLIENIDLITAKTLQTKIENISGVSSAVLNTTKISSNLCALYTITLQSSNFDTQSFETISTIRNELSGYRLSFAGAAVRSSFLQTKINQDMVVILLVSFIVLISILIITSTSWIDPLVFIIVMGVAIVINLGLNALLPNISFISKSICIVLQLALSVDYSIILLHRFNEEKAKTTDIKTAAAKALSKTFAPISASSLTTIGGLAALMFMRYTIGFDIGLVLIKGIVLSLLTTIFLMPSVLIIFSKLLEKTAHRSIFEIIKSKSTKLSENEISPYKQQISPVNTKKHRSFSDFQYNSRIVIPVILVLIVAAGFILQSELKYEYFTEPSKDASASINIENNNIEKIYGIQNSLVIMVPKGDYEKEQRLINYLSDYKYNGINVFNSAQGLITTDLSDLINEYNSSEISAKFNISEAMVSIAFNQMGKSNEKVVLLDFLNFLDSNDFAKNYSNVMQQEIDNQFIQSQSLFLELTAAQFATIFNIDITQAIAIYSMMQAAPTDKIAVNQTLMFISTNQLFLLSGNPSGQQSVDQMYQGYLTVSSLISKTQLVSMYGLSLDAADSIFIHYQAATAIETYKVLEYIYVNKTISNMGASLSVTINELCTTALSGIAMFEGENYSRLFFNMNLNISSPEVFDVIADLKEKLPLLFYDEIYLLSESANLLEIKNLFSEDVLTINLISFFAIFIIILLSFRSLSLPVILTILIQGAIWVTMSLSAITSTPIFFICYLVISCIQMGATVDFAILMSSRYIEARISNGPKQSMSIAFNAALPTILTSGSIMVIAALIVGLGSSITIVSSLGLTLSLGCLISLLFITFALPQILVVCDKFITKTTLGLNNEKLDKK